MTVAPATVDPEAVAQAAAACADVAGLSEGAVGEVASYLPGRRVPGVRIGDNGVEVHIVARWGRPLPEVGEAVAAAVAPVASGHPVQVFIDDLDVPAEAVPPERRSTPASP